jgi:hypothetical protein
MENVLRLFCSRRRGEVERLGEMFTGARIMRDEGKEPQWAKWRTPRLVRTRPGFSLGAAGSFAVEPALIPPNADCDPRFQMKFLQDVLNVLLHGAGTAAQDLPDLTVSLRGRDPFHHFKLALRQRARLSGSEAL